jgi:branched-chain amino acid transport system ATP-binding protein
MAELLSIRGLQASYGRAQALFDISLDVAQGEVVTLLGRNGMGRSTTVKCLFGLLAPKAGAITFGGKRIEQLPSYKVAKCGLGLVPEGRQIFADLSVEENLIATARPGINKSLKPWTLQRAYAFFPRLAERKRNMGSQLSGGEQQMLAIARALMTNPSLLVLDEATEGLAPVIRADIWRALVELKNDGLSMIVIDKNIQSLMSLANKHYVIEKGRIAWQGSSAQLREEPELVHRYLGV